MCDNHSQSPFVLNTKCKTSARIVITKTKSGSGGSNASPFPISVWKVVRLARYVACRHYKLFHLRLTSPSSKKKTSKVLQPCPGQFWDTKCLEPTNKTREGAHPVFHVNERPTAIRKLPFVLDAINPFDASSWPQTHKMPILLRDNHENAESDGIRIASSAPTKVG